MPFHKQASKAAEAAHCADEQGKYWEMHDQIFANQKDMDLKDFSEYAKKIGLDVTKFQQCVDNGKYTEAIKKGIAEGQRAGVTGAPSFFIGYTEPDKPKTVKAIKMIKGAQPYSKFKEAIDSLLLQK